MNKCKVTWGIVKFALGALLGGAAVYTGTFHAAAPEIKLSCPKAVLSCPKCPGYVVQPLLKENCK